MVRSLNSTTSGCIRRSWRLNEYEPECVGADTTFPSRQYGSDMAEVCGIFGTIIGKKPIRGSCMTIAMTIRSCLRLDRGAKEPITEDEAHWQTFREVVDHA
jgi:hypothetical protein